MQYKLLKEAALRNLMEEDKTTFLKEGFDIRKLIPWEKKHKCGKCGRVFRHNLHKPDYYCIEDPELGILCPGCSALKRVEKEWRDYKPPPFGYPDKSAKREEDDDWEDPYDRFSRYNMDFP